ncbi:MAG: 4Fe-4S dicluster domain-containing protein, partial [Acidimicrobiia bacterium]
MPDIAAAQARWVKVIDQSVCIGCHACTTACKSENDVPLGVNRTYVKYVDAGIFPQVRRSYQVTRCNQCADAPCVAACPTAAMYRRPDGIVDFDKRICVGCKACMAACPYDAIFINPDDHSAEKCNLCAHRLEIGLEPSCVVVCPVGAILVGDAGDPTSAVARIVAEVPTAVRRPEIGTGPNLHYVGAGRETLDPLAARRPGGGIFMWSEQGGDGSRQPAATADTAPVLAYDVPHRIPWDWRVSLYTWTKGVAAGAWLVAVALWVAGTVGFSDDLVRWAAPGTAAVFLALTAGILVWDLEHPERFWLILLRPQWRSWLVRGGFILSGYALILGAHLVASVLDAPGLAAAAAVPGVPLGVMAAVYTAWLFAACKGRDLWQSRLLPAHLAV